VRTYHYRIVVSGELAEPDREAFADLQIESDGATTVLQGDKDQSGLHGVLNRIRHLGLELIELTRITGNS
jgi:hypothetical protein